MKINITKPFGCFHVAASCEVDEKLQSQLIQLGALYLFERGPSQGVEQKVFGPLLHWELTDSGTSYKRPKGFERNSVAFTPELAAKVKAAYDSTPGILKDGEDKIKVKFTVNLITEHETGESSPMQRATLFVDSLLADVEKSKSLRMLLDLQGMKGSAKASREDMIEFCHSKGMGIQVARKGKKK